MALRIDFDNPEIIVYDVDGRFYDAVELRHIELSQDTIDRLSAPLVTIEEMLAKNPSTNPVFISFQGGWLIASSERDYSTGLLTGRNYEKYLRVLAEEGNKYHINFFEGFTIPTGLMSGRGEVINFVDLPLEGFDLDLLQRLETIQIEDQNFGVVAYISESRDDTGRIVETKIYFYPESPLSESEELIAISPVTRRETQVLSPVTRRETQVLSPITQRETQPVSPQPGRLPAAFNIAGINAPVIPFSDLGTRISPRDIARFYIDPELQAWAKSSNQIVTLFLKSGLTYVVEAQYNPSINQLFPPV